MNAQSLARLDQRHVWHPFTQMRDWMKNEPIVLVSGSGATVTDTRGRSYLDANSSIWTNLHGHGNAVIDEALRRQLSKVAHTSALGLANEPASLLAGALLSSANPRSALHGPKLTKVFFSDDGSTAMEVALKLAYEHTRRTRGPKPGPRFLSVAGAYHGDTIGGVSLGHIPRFHAAFNGLLFRSDAAMSPACYRCRFDQAAPARADARTVRKCRWECVDQVERQFDKAARSNRPYSAWIVEPLMQGAAGMVAQPAGWLRRTVEIARAHRALVIADEVMTAFGRVGADAKGRFRLLASHLEDVQPDFAALAKGLTGGYLPMAATLTSDSVFDSFLGEYDEFKSFFHGHSYTGNQLGAAAGLASMSLLKAPGAAANRRTLESQMRSALADLWDIPWVGDIRQAGLVAGVELTPDWTARSRFEPGLRVGGRVCEAMARRGVLTRPVGDVIVLMPPFCTTHAQMAQMVSALRDAVLETLGNPSSNPRRVSGIPKAKRAAC